MRILSYFLSLLDAGCKDIDDALHCYALPNGNFEVGVRILSLKTSILLMVLVSISYIYIYMCVYVCVAFMDYYYYWMDVQFYFITCLHVKVILTWHEF
jgi:hypothetical protein